MRSESSTRLCKTCQRSLPLTPEFFPPCDSKGHMRGTCRECYNAWKREHYRKNHDSILASQRIYYWSRPEIRRQNARDYYQSHRERAVARAKKWRKENPGWNNDRRARIRGAIGSHTAADVRSQLLRQKRRCYWCGEKLRDYHIDHVVPIALGGGNGPENIVIACPSCNMRKAASHPMDFGGRLL